MSPLRVLLVRLSAVGDCVHAMPVACALREAFGDARIGWVVDDRAAAVVRGHPALSRLHVLPRQGGLGGLRRTVAELRAERYDVAIDLQGLMKSALLARLSGAKRRIGFADDARELSWLLTNERVRPPGSARHVVERNLALLAPLGVEAAAVRFGLAVDAGARGRMDAALDEMDLAAGRFALFNPGAGWPTKRWPVTRFAELGARLAREQGLGVLVVWAGAPERAMAERLAAEAGESARVAPETDLAELAALAARAGLFVGADTGPTHMAAALGVPTVALFGASDPVRNRPLGERVRVVTAGVDCAPCWRSRACPHEAACMSGITAGRVAAAAAELLGGGGDGSGV